MGFPGGSAGKESACKTGDLGLIPGLGRSSEEGKGYPFQYSGLENSMDCIVHGVAKNHTCLSDFHFSPTLFLGPLAALTGKERTKTPEIFHTFVHLLCQAFTTKRKTAWRKRWSDMSEKQHGIAEIKHEFGETD